MVSSEYSVAGMLRGIRTLIALERVLVGDGSGRPALLRA
jgi:hypothetical protein